MIEVPLHLLRVMWVLFRTLSKLTRVGRLHDENPVIEKQIELLLDRQVRFPLKSPRTRVTTLGTRLAVVGQRPVGATLSAPTLLKKVVTQGVAQLPRGTLVVP